MVRILDDVPHVLLIRDPYRKWGLPKGHAEEGETVPEAALREVAEETGLTDLRIEQELVTIDWTFRAGPRKVHKFATFFLMRSESGEPVPDESEGITECAWVPLDEADRTISYDNASEVMRVAQQAWAR